MKIFSYSSLSSSSLVRKEIASSLDRGELVCLPCNNTYRIVADLSNADAVVRLAQSKRRVGKVPSLIFVSDKKMLQETVSEIKPEITPLFAFWPGPLTIRFKLNSSFPRIVLKQLGKGKIGIRIPIDPHVRNICKTLNRPLLVSSANRQRKRGEGSPAQVVKSFSTQVDIFVEHGELQPSKHSTVCEMKKGNIKIVRSGSISQKEIEEVFKTF